MIRLDEESVLKTPGPKKLCEFESHHFRSGVRNCVIITRLIDPAKSNTIDGTTAGSRPATSTCVIGSFPVAMHGLGDVGNGRGVLVPTAVEVISRW